MANQVTPGEADLCGTLLLGRYKLLARLGKGGMGTVYLGEHVAIGKKFAIKVLGSEHARRPDLVQRFLQEARAASMIAQQNVVEISDFGDTPDGSVFFVMEFLDGEDLGAALQRERRLPWARVQHMMVQVCRALEAAHAVGVVHRDMKPDNCFRITRGRDPDFIKVLDFGIAKVQTGGKGLTKTGMVFGTPEYMAPEQGEGAATDHRVDIYAVGVIMYELLCGRVPFLGATFMAILTRHMFEFPEPPSVVAPDANIPIDAEALVLKALQKDPALRFANMAQMAAAIEAVGTGVGPVEVVREHIVRPAGGPTAFAARSTGSQHRSGSADAGRKGGVVLGIVGVLAAAVVAGVFVFQGERGEAAPPSVRADALPASVEPAVVAAPSVAPEPAAPETVRLEFSTNVPARIVDATDGAIMGNTADAEGLVLERSDRPLALLLRAEGYEDLPVEVVPSKDKHYDLELASPAKPSAGSRRKQARASEQAAAPEATTEPHRPKTVREGDLKNPFGR